MCIRDRYQRRVHGVWFNIQLDYTLVAMGLSYCFNATWDLIELVQNVAGTEQSLVSVERISQFLDIPCEQLDEKTSQLQPSTSDELIQFQNVSFSYSSSPHLLALDDVSFAIRKGEKVAFCGRTGSGKSSILNVLFRLYEIRSGVISLQGNNISDLPLRTLRSSLAIIPQFGFLFRGTLRENLDPTGNLDAETVRVALKEFGLTLGKAKDGEVDLDMPIAEGGANLSYGEKQVVNFLRVILQQDSDIVCLDEANANVDPITDERLMKLVLSATANKTLLMISHRLDNLRHFDRVIVMDAGRIVEAGTFDDLSRQPNSHLSQLRHRTALE
eukprot:TRINITY_DN13215_c0_g1_i2.p1 TRINITY_DN13215_c0_g1~~TRINITY_DN13215_c0_g1_i2.p1  ORF type:complete len:348 (-),score=87.33 TRINITY_DN13215_c0_g1_i2:102-1088(-)